MTRKSAVAIDRSAVVIQRIGLDAGLPPELARKLIDFDIALRASTFVRMAEEFLQGDNDAEDLELLKVWFRYC